MPFMMTDTDYATIETSSPPISGLAPYTGAWGNDQVVHLLKRTMFGATKADVDHFAALTLTATITELLTSSTPTQLPLNNYSGNANYPDVNAALGQTWVNAAYDGNLVGVRRNSLKAWWIGLMINQTRSIQEKMVLFWHNHFATDTNNFDPTLAYVHYVTLRQYALGNFKAFVKAITLDPHMLYFLNGRNSVKGSPDENYGREVQELFTIGKNVDGTTPYTEADVKAAARLLTGYQVDYNARKGIFTPTRHDSTDKQFSAFYGNKLIAGRTLTDGAKELDDFIDMLFATPNTASYICRKIYRFFVYYDVTPDVETNVIQPLALILKNNNFEIKPVLQALFSSQHFFDTANYGVVIKPPLDLLIGMMREFNVVFPDATNYLPQYGMWFYLFNVGSTISQSLGEPPNVAGWPAYYQTPVFHEIWVNTDTLPKRLAFTDNMIASGYSTLSQKIIIDVVAFTQSMPTPADPNLLISDVLAHLYRVPVQSDFITGLKSILLSNQASDHYWTDAWTAYLANPTDKTNLNIVTTRLKSFYKYLLDQMEYQLQ